MQRCNACLLILLLLKFRPTQLMLQIVTKPIPKSGVETTGLFNNPSTGMCVNSFYFLLSAQAVQQVPRRGVQNHWLKLLTLGYFIKNGAGVWNLYITYTTWPKGSGKLTSRWRRSPTLQPHSLHITASLQCLNIHHHVLQVNHEDMVCQVCRGGT